MAVSKRFCITSAIIGIIVTVVLIGLGLWILITSRSNSDDGVKSNETVKAPFINFEEGLIIKKGSSEILGFILSENVTVLLARNQMDIILGFDYYMNKTVYYSTSGSRQPIVSASSDYADLVHPSESWYASAVAVDFLTEKVYVYDKEGNKIDLFDVKHHYHAILLSDLPALRDIALDPYRGLMFMLHSKSRISMANMDGTNIETIVEEDLDDILAFAVDFVNTTLYWSTPVEISSYNYIAKKLLRMAIPPSAVTSLAVLGNQLYFIGQDNPSKSTVYQCRMVDGKCKDYDKLIFDNAELVRAYAPLYLPEVENVCGDHNDGCEHFCLPSATNYSCACAIGWQLNSDDDWSCSPVSEYILYVRDYYIRGRILERSAKQIPFADAIVPRPIRVTSVETKKIIEVDYNAHRKYLILSDDHAIYLINLQANNSQLQLSFMTDDLILYPNVDWIGNSVFYLRINENKKTAYLMLQETNRFTDYDNQKTIYKFAEGQIPRALAIDPNGGYAFLTIYDKEKGKMQIYGVGTDGSAALQQIALEGAEFSVNGIALAFDCIEKRLYWLNAECTHFQYASNKDMIVHSFEISFVKDPMRLSIHDRWLYISSSKTIWRVDKMTGAYDDWSLAIDENDEKGWLSATKIFSEREQPIREGHPCAFDNGGCGRYCIAANDSNDGLRRVCACNDNERLESDEKSCRYQPPPWQLPVPALV